MTDPIEDKEGSPEEKPKPKPRKPPKAFDVKRKRALKKNYKAKFQSENTIRVRYKPEPKQKVFADLIESGKKVVCYIGGRQGGKTYAGGYEALKQIYKYGRQPSLGWIVSPTYPMSKAAELSFEEAAGFYENGGLILRKLRGERAYIMHPPKGQSKPFRVEVKTTEHPDRLRGARVGFIWMDEAAMMSVEAYKIMLACTLSSRGIIFMTTTPRGHNWLHELYKQSTKNPALGMVQSRSDENSYLTEDQIAMIRGQYSHDFARQELDAEFVSFEGLVYKNFRIDSHVIPPLMKMPEGAEMIGGVDNGYADPFVHLWVVKKGDTYYVVDEYYEKGRTMEYVSRAIKANRWDKHTIRRWADPSGAQERAELDRFSIGTYPARNDEKAGINEVARVIDHGKLFISQTCVNTIKEICQYHYESREGRNTGEKPVDCNNHAMDALRYVLMSESQYTIHNPYIETGDDGVQVVHDGPVDFMSNSWDEWLRFEGNMTDLYND